MSDDIHILICAPWDGYERAYAAGDNPNICVKVHCHKCGEALAMDASNSGVKVTMGLQPMCLFCGLLLYADKADEFVFGGYMVGGKLYAESQRKKKPS